MNNITDDRCRKVAEVSEYIIFFRLRRVVFSKKYRHTIIFFCIIPAFLFQLSLTAKEKKMI